jgi:DNA polymerase-3 subunit delta
MSSSASIVVAARHPPLAAVLAAAAAGRIKPAYLLIGEPFETRAAAEALLDALVPAAHRAFNLETYDGRTTPMATVIDSARMPGFFPGRKVIWLRESTAFLSGEKRPEMTKALLAAWGEGRETEAAEKLLTLVAMAGWSQAEFRETQWVNLSKARLREVFGEAFDGESLRVLAAVQAACLARDLSVGAYRDDSTAMVELLDAGMPPHAVLVFTTATVDARKRLVKRLREVGTVVELTVSRERSGALSRDTVDAVVQHTVREFGKCLAADAQALISQRAGADLALLAGEMEKLCLYAGDQPTITVADVRAVFPDMAESWIFDFTAALAARQLARALPLLRGLAEQGEPALRVLALIAREVRMLLLARECLDGPLQGKWRGGMPFNAFQSRLLPLVDDDSKAAFGTVHPFALYRRFQDAERVDARVLREALVRLSELDIRLKSSRSDPFMLLEAFVIDWCARRARAPVPPRT